MTQSTLQNNDSSPHDRLEDIIEKIAIYWRIQDVQEIRPDLSNYQASQVLKTIKENHDVSKGINWETIMTIANDLFPIEICNSSRNKTSLTITLTWQLSDVIKHTKMSIEEAQLILDQLNNHKYLVESAGWDTIGNIISGDINNDENCFY